MLPTCLPLEKLTVGPSGDMKRRRDERQETDETGMKYVRVLWRPFESDYQCEEGFNLSPGLEDPTVCGFSEQPTYCTNDCVQFIFHQNVQAAPSHKCECTQLCSWQSAEAERFKRLSSGNGKWIDVACCRERSNEQLVFFERSRVNAE